MVKVYQKICGWCNRIFVTTYRDQTFCSISHAQLFRYRNPEKVGTDDAEYNQHAFGIMPPQKMKEWLNT